MLLLWVLLVAGCSGQGEVKDTLPRVRDARIDLTGWKPGNGQPIRLGGEWDFFWDQLLTPGDFDAGLPQPTPTTQLPLPIAWDLARRNGQRWPRNGVATFRLRLHGLPLGEQFSLWVPEQRTAYRIWFAGKLVAANGVVTRGRADPQPRPIARLVSVTADRHDADLVLQVANYHATHGGPVGALALGSETVLRDDWERRKYVDVLLFGCLFVMGVYHAGLYWFRRQERPSLYVALACLAFALRIPLFGLGGRFIVEVLPQISWESAERTRAALSLWGIAAAALYVHSCLQPTGVANLSRWFALGAAPLGLLALTVPRWVVGLALYPVLALTGAACLVLFIPVIQEVRRGARHARHLLISWSLLAATGQAEIVGYWLGNTGTQLPIMPIGMLLFMLAQSWLAASRSHAAFVAVESLSRELTERNTELVRMEAIKEDFLAQTSHELRTPLHGIVGLSEMLLAGRAGRLSTGARDALQLVVSGGRRLGVLVGDLLDVSRLRRGDIQLSLQPVDLHTLTQATLALLNPEAEEKGLELVSDVPQGLPPARADERRLHQILINLVGNAVKYTQAGEVRVSARVCGGDLAWRVSDTGSGIPAAQLRAVARGTGRLASVGAHGAGLGLGITRDLVALHGGRLDVESVPGVGSSFVVHLPRADTQAATQPAVSSPARPDRAAKATPCTCLAAASESLLGPQSTAGTTELQPARQLAPEPLFVEDDPLLPRPAARGSAGNDTPQVELSETETEEGAVLRGARVVVVDDDEINLRVVEQHLLHAAADVVPTRNANEARRRLEDTEERFDLALVDVMMPSVTGYDLTRTIRERYRPEELPVLLLTARSQPADIALGFDVGANDYLVKPFSRVELVARCRLHVALKRAFESAANQLRLERELKEQESSLARANLRAVNAELDMLRYQVNPHLLFNTLTSIRGAIPVDADAAREMVTMLAEYYRFTLDSGGTVRLADELEMTRIYLKIHESRQRLAQTVTWNIEAATEDFLVPSLLLQPLVENAVMRRRRDLDGRVAALRIAAWLEPGGMRLRISNEGEWFTPNSARAGIGLRNVQQRLVRHYGEESRLQTREQDGWVHVELRLPHAVASPPPGG